MARSHSSPSPAKKPRSRTFRLLMGIVYLAAIAGLIVWEYRDHVDLGASGCEASVREAKSSLYARSYERLLDWASGESAGHVTAIAIPAELEDIHSNLCEARSYLADLVRSIDAQHPAEIVIDKFFSPTACSNSPQNTAELLAAVRSVGAPVVIGENAASAPAERQGSCLVRKPQLDFAAPNVIHGLTRRNIEAEKVPLQWHILTSDEGSNAPPEVADSLSLAAVKAYDSGYQQHRRLQTLLSNDDHPYANLRVDIPRETSTQLLCDSGTAAMQQRWGVTCTGPMPHLRLLGKVVLIGAEDERDRLQVLDTRIWGFELQARYIQVMLSGNYLRALPVWTAFFTFASFIFMIEGLPTVLEALVPHWRKHWFLAHAFTERRYLWVVFWMVCFPCVTTVLALSFGYLPPLAVLGDIFFVAITRLFFFAAETTGTPFLNPKKKGTS